MDGETIVERDDFTSALVYDAVMLLPDGREFSVEEICQLAGRDAKNGVKSALGRMEQVGILRNPMRGVYALVDRSIPMKIKGRPDTYRRYREARIRPPSPGPVAPATPAAERTAFQVKVDAVFDALILLSREGASLAVFSTAELMAELQARIGGRQ